jgi:hypothetical protein
MTSVKELKEKAKALKIPKYYKMKKAELLEAIKLAEYSEPESDRYELVLITPCGSLTIHYDTEQEAMAECSRTRSLFPQYQIAEIYKNKELYKRLSLRH